MAVHDKLTGLLNFAGLSARMTELLEEGSPGMLIMADLDRFKFINDTMGHAAGDSILTITAERMSTALPDGGFLARLGGDEFVMVLKGRYSPGDAMDFADRLLSALAQPMHVKGRELVCRASMGVSLIPADGGSTSKIMDNADLALYAAKEAGRGIARLFQSGMQHKADRLAAEAQQLIEAADQGRARVGVWPLRSAEDGRITGCQTCIVWEKPDGSATVVERLEDSIARDDRAAEISARYFVSALRELQGCCGSLFSTLTIKAGLGRAQLGDSALPRKVASVLDLLGMPASTLQIDLSEDVFALAGEETLNTLRSLREMDVTLSISGYGSGTTAPARLLAAGIQMVSLPAGHNCHPGDAQLHDALAQMARTLGIAITGEGYIQGGPDARLAALGCTSFICAREKQMLPMTVEAFARKLAAEAYS
ncbi:diguanylate cyclase domain-containing protein [Pannonibacter phragmitetus]|uniref:diguanylate cyclase domain-containing protein n=1 Tax=Pannonibacter phragmitetus TaxID=121719 RepID=UPI003D2F0B34